MKMLFSITSMAVVISACSTIEKHYEFKSDSSLDHPGWIKCRGEKYGNDVVKVGDDIFYFLNSFRDSAWVGPLLIPVIPVRPGKSMTELNLVVSGPAEANASNWSVEFASDRLTVKPEQQLSQSKYWKFKFPARPISEPFELVIPQGQKSVRVHYPARNVEFKYVPLMLPIGDSFPDMFGCEL